MQLIMAVHIKLTLFKDDIVDLWLSDNSRGADLVVNRLNSLNLFHCVKYMKWQHLMYNQSIISNLKDLVSYNFYPIENMDIEFYDEIIYYNPVMELFAIADYYKKMRHSVIWSRFDEGILSYNTDLRGGKRYELCRKIRKVISREDPFLHVSRYYCMFPHLKLTHLEWELIKIPGLDNDKEELRDILNEAFDFTPVQLPHFVFFASSSDVDGNPFGETEFVLALANHVGRSNLIVKTHPRDNRTIYEDNGLQVMEHSFVPWEVIQLNLMSTSLHLLTVNSGSFISITAMMNDNKIKGDFLFNCISCDSPGYKARSAEITIQLQKLHKGGLGCSLSDKIFSILEIA